MSDQPASPFSGLDKALLRSTQPRHTDTTPAETAAARDDNGQQPAPPRATKATKGAKATQRQRPPTVTTTVDPIDELQQQLKTLGKEIYYIRITPQEKAAIEDVLHALKRRGLRTSATNSAGSHSTSYWRTTRLMARRACSFAFLHACVRKRVHACTHACSLSCTWPGAA